MGRNEIRLRRQRMTARGIDRFRNYNTVLERHEQTQRIKKVVKAFGFFIAILIVIMLIIFLSRWEKRYGLEKTVIQNFASLMEQDGLLKKGVTDTTIPNSTN